MKFTFEKVNVMSVMTEREPPQKNAMMRTSASESFAMTRLYDRGEVARVTHDFKFSLVVDRTAVPVSRSESGK